MRKKTNNKRKEPELYMRRPRVIIDDLSFDLTTPSQETHFGVTYYGSSDKLYCEIRFNPPLEKVYATTSVLTVTHIESKYRGPTPVVILPKSQWKRAHETYIEFPTHVAQIGDTNAVTRILVTFVNIQMRGDCSARIMDVQINYGLGCFPELFPDRYESLPFVPLETAPKDLVLSKIPQGINMTIIKPTLGITGGNVPRLLGYYPRNDNVSAWAAVAIRFGYKHEDTVKAIYLSAHPTFKYKEVGFLTLSLTDGAMPDGLIQDETGQEFCVEFKTSRANTSFGGDNIAQSIYQMACGPYPWHDLVKYSEKPECRENRLYRSEIIEETIIRLCRQAKGVYGAKLEELHKTEEFVKFREYLDTLAAEATVQGKWLPIPEDVLAKMEEHAQEIRTIQVQDVLSIHPLLDRIEKRQGSIFAEYQQKNRKVFLQQVVQQIQDYGEIIKEEF